MIYLIIKTLLIVALTLSVVNLTLLAIIKYETWQKEKTANKLFNLRSQIYQKLCLDLEKNADMLKNRINNKTSEENQKIAEI